MKSKVRFGSTYQAIALNFLFLTHGLFLLMISGGNLLWGILPSLGASLAFLIPAILMFIRIDVFDDSSVYLNEKSIIGIGFNPTLYYFISLAIGLYGYFNGFKSNNLIWILVVFLFQLLLAFPDKVNKYVPFEVKTKNGC